MGEKSYSRLECKAVSEQNTNNALKSISGQADCVTSSALSTSSVSFRAPAEPFWSSQRALATTWGVRRALKHEFIQNWDE